MALEPKQPQTALVNTKVIMRSKPAKLRSVTPDTKYGSEKIARFINRVMQSGKRTIAEKLVYQALDLLQTQTKQNSLEVFDQAISNIIPKIEVRSRRVGGAAYQVPVPVSPRRGFSLALRWLIQEAKKRPNADYPTFAHKLAAELKDALDNQGGAVQKRLTSHKMAEANKAFAHFRW